MITIQRELISKIRYEVEELINIHYDEIALHKEYIDLNVFWEGYQYYEDNGMSNVLTARKDGKIIGYIVDLIQKSMHYQDHMFAMNDVFFVHPDHRTGSIGLKLFKAEEEYLKDMGVSVWVVQTKAFKSAGKLLERRGFTHGDNQYVKYIKGEAR